MTKQDPGEELVDSIVRAGETLNEIDAEVERLLHLVAELRNEP